MIKKTRGTGGDNNLPPATEAPAPPGAAARAGASMQRSPRGVPDTMELSGAAGAERAALARTLAPRLYPRAQFERMRDGILEQAAQAYGRQHGLYATVFADRLEEAARHKIPYEPYLEVAEDLLAWMLEAGDLRRALELLREPVYARYVQARAEIAAQLSGALLRVINGEHLAPPNAGTLPPGALSVAGELVTSEDHGRLIASLPQLPSLARALPYAHQVARAAHSLTQRFAPDELETLAALTTSTEGRALENKLRMVQARLDQLLNCMAAR